MDTIENISTMEMGKRYKAFLVNHEEHYSTISYVYFCGRHEGDYVVATKVGYVFLNDKDKKYISGEWEHCSSGTPYSIVIYK